MPDPAGPPDRRLAEVTEKVARTSSKREKMEILRGYYREQRNENEHRGEGRKYADRKEMR